MIYNSIVTEAS